VVTHCGALLAAIDAAAGGQRPRRMELTKERGETKLVGPAQLDEPNWRWPA